MSDMHRTSPMLGESGDTQQPVTTVLIGRLLNRLHLVAQTRPHRLVRTILGELLKLLSRLLPEIPRTLTPTPLWKPAWLISNRRLCYDDLSDRKLGRRRTLLTRWSSPVLTLVTTWLITVPPIGLLPPRGPSSLLTNVDMLCPVTLQVLLLGARWALVTTSLRTSHLLPLPSPRRVVSASTAPVLPVDRELGASGRGA